MQGWFYFTPRSDLISPSQIAHEVWIGELGPLEVSSCNPLTVSESSSPEVEVFLNLPPQYAIPRASHRATDAPNVSGSPVALSGVEQVALPLSLVRGYDGIIYPSEHKLRLSKLRGNLTSDALWLYGIE